MKASLSLDLDNKWSYMMVHGDQEWRSLPSYVDIVVPRFLEFLDAYRLKITVFIVGKDAEIPEHHAALRSIVLAGHEVGNHSHSHEPWLHKRTVDEIDAEIADAERAIEAATGMRPLGFRGPGYARSPVMLEALARRGYLYDASVLSTWIGPLARAYYLRSTRTGFRGQGAARRPVRFRAGRLRSELPPRGLDGRGEDRGRPGHDDADPEGPDPPRPTSCISGRFRGRWRERTFGRRSRRAG